MDIEFSYYDDTLQQKFYWSRDIRTEDLNFNISELKGNSSNPKAIINIIQNMWFEHYLIINKKTISSSFFILLSISFKYTIVNCQDFEAILQVLRFLTKLE